jgi:heavy metal sensor kinase
MTARAARRPLPARLQLMLWYALLLIGTQVLLGGLAYWLLQRTLYNSADEVLRHRAAAVEAEVDYENGRLLLELEGQPADQMPTFAAGLDLLRLWDRRQRLVYQNAGLADVPPPSTEALAEALGDRPTFSTARAADGASVRLYLTPAHADGPIRGVLQIGRSEAEIEALLANVRAFGWGSLLVVVALACGGGYFLAARALRPVDEITRAAEQISAGRLSQRLGLALPDDELGRLARAFDRMIERLEQAFERQRRFTDDASHELRTPLAIMRSQIDLALDRPREPRADREALLSLRDEIDRLAGLAESLLLLARADSDRPIPLAPIDLDELLVEIGERVAARARERGLRLELQLAESAALRGQASLLRQLLLNLLDNALRHTPPGGQVTISSETAPGGVLVKVADSGEGIAAEHLPRVFERFYRADPARGRTSGGSGLGLAICDWIAQVHGGRLTLASEPGRGTTASLWLPATTPPASDQQPQPRLPTPVTVGGGRPSQPADRPPR